MIQLYLTKLARLGGYLARTSDPPRVTPSSGAAYVDLPTPRLGWGSKLMSNRKPHRSDTAFLNPYKFLDPIDLASPAGSASEYPPKCHCFPVYGTAA
jgi:hypothetical protein